VRMSVRPFATNRISVGGDAITFVRPSVRLYVRPSVCFHSILGLR